MQKLSDLEPRQRHLVFDLAEKAGLDMAEWIGSSNDPRGPKANPKFCYEWAYVEPKKLIILNLWHANMVEEDGFIIQRDNFRLNSQFHRTVSRNSVWTGRSSRFDDAIQTALRDNLPVRVIVLDGLRRNRDDLESEASRVTKRELDPEYWTITSYNWDTGAFELTRGILTGRYIDQFVLDQAAKSNPERRDRIASTLERNPAVRRRVLERAAGHCELCGQAGFRMENGGVYLETHHVIPLSEGGADEDINVVALCAHDHRRAHFASDRAPIRKWLTEIAISKQPLASRVLLSH